MYANRESAFNDVAQAFVDIAGEDEEEEAKLLNDLCALHEMMDGEGRPYTPIQRKRKDVSEIFAQLGTTWTRRSYRMHEESFWKLVSELDGTMDTSSLFPDGESRKNHRNGATNGLIPDSLRVSAALRYFAGGSVADIHLTHGISAQETYHSVDLVIDAINQCPALAFSFPENHRKQRDIAAGFKRKSKANFACCAGAIDCMLLWISRPPEVGQRRIV